MVNFLFKLFVMVMCVIVSTIITWIGEGETIDSIIIALILWTSIEREWQ